MPHTNLLIHEKSPYLLQHAHNPVEWHPWGDAAFAKAKNENKPIFLSIGYSTCYWCHVMEREVFENESIAKLMNEFFVNIKVDREERPDIDRIYMTALQGMIGSGGWPLNMFLTPDLKPFYGATYIPPKAKYGRTGFEDVINEINNVWKTKQQEVVSSGNKVLQILTDASIKDVKDDNDITITDDILHKLYEQIHKIADHEHGGFGQGNKFPRPVIYTFLFGYFYSTKILDALDTAIFTLQKMHRGGMYDHLEGGFHRYSVDYLWRVPHFEKMLYDQALLVNSYIDAFRITKKVKFLQPARETLDYILRRLTSPEGGFYSAEDAESAIDAGEPDVKEEGAFYLWEIDEINKILGKDSAIFNYHFGIQPGGNTISDPHNVFGTKNVLYIENDFYDTAKFFNIAAEEAERIISGSKAKLIDERNKRVRPHLDDKILTSWNGLMISAFANGYEVTGEEKYLKAAEAAAEFILDSLYKEEKLLHRYRDNESAIDGNLEDYAFLIFGLLDLYEASFNAKYLTFSKKLCDTAIEMFYDSESGGFFDTVEKKDIILRTKDDYDGAEPSGNSIMINNLLRMGIITGDKNYTALAENSIRYFYTDLEKSAFSSPMMIHNISFLLSPPKEIIISGSKKEKQTNEMTEIIYKEYIPFKALLFADADTEEISSFIKNITGQTKELNVYICENYSCKLPVNSPEKLKEIL